MSRFVWPLTAVLVAAILSAGAVLASRSVSQQAPPAPAGADDAPTPGASVVNAGRAAASLETDPMWAKLYAENAVGNCLQQAWGNAGYPNVFDQYAGSGVVQFSTGTAGDPTGSAEAGTLISVYVYENGTISDNSALDHWGCKPFKYHPREGNGQVPADGATPSGLAKDGSLDSGCRLTFTEGIPTGATLILFNPGLGPVTVHRVGIEQISNHILMNQSVVSSNAFTLNSGATTTIPVTFNGASSATSCQTGWS